ncbi:nucleotidyltransferase domain-containing protein [Candidatus Woesearchaeota archaeon]|nr:nucleotidyltransferase domain-containing protein [Candidatus Woesearchaeota archaeon]
MLDLFYQLAPFFEDVYREVSVRQYAKLTSVSPPTASITLRRLESEGLLISRPLGIYLFFKPTLSYQFKQLAQAYWQKLLYDHTEALHEEVDFNDIILFGSIAKTENNANSDIDIYVNSSHRNIKCLGALEKKLKRRVELHFKTTSPLLKDNIDKGIRIR